ncbi:homoserine kinase [Chryseobacterium indologenes]|uniref:homoserine kinase n=1 Tax=Chryseobacterium indologenes TaxID=253 RepID=UPI000F4DF1A6|nr:homoserine kinase [Chryseobacterium indologenes]AYZ34452.1 homoserine kinase [Chryseobacterium indologenes]MBF6643000.1 homoserine kinase [Chryseobacterium indologenes]MBU3049717.1 homoserine kinase [Chryseobacterium indologenes]MEB4759171.1 homoserine kinase [Chryseobacterium indologenes]QQQ73118.1 homoserine kinase [Chryseobacterium indologenes]
MKKVKLRVPATVANLVCGFDILGMAIHDPYDEMELKLLDSPDIIIKHEDSFGLPEQPSKNVAGVVLQKIQEHLKLSQGFEVIIRKHIKPGSGLGSSAASAAGAAFGANALLGDILCKEELIHFAMFGEELASGVRHADNIAPCIYGGITLVKTTDPIDIIPLNAPDLFVAAVHPQVEVKTSDSRQILKKSITLKSAVEQWGNIAGLVAGIQKNDLPLIGRSLKDVIIEPVRSILIPKFDEIKMKSLQLGALGGGISGSGPSIFMLAEKKEMAEKIADLMKTVYDEIEIESYTYVSKINPAGIKIIPEA